MMKILFICRSNVMRSQIAEALFNSIGSKHIAKSAGVEVEEKYLGKKLVETTKFVVPVMKEIGIDVSNNISKQLTEKMVSEADKIIIMAEKDKCPKYLFSSPKVVFWNIADPRHGGIEDQRKVLDEINKHIAEFIKEIDAR